MSKRLIRTTLAAAGILVAIGGCSDANPAASGAAHFLSRGTQARLDVSGNTGSAVIDSRGGTVQTPAGDRLVFPAGALSAPTTITLTSSSDYVGVEVQPHGIAFPAGAEPVLTLNATGANLKGLHSVNVDYVDESGALAETLQTSVSGGRLTASVHHFSKYYAVGG